MCVFHLDDADTTSTFTFLFPFLANCRLTETSMNERAHTGDDDDDDNASREARNSIFFSFIYDVRVKN